MRNYFILIFLFLSIASNAGNNKIEKYLKKFNIRSSIINGIPVSGANSILNIEDPLHSDETGLLYLSKRTTKVRLGWNRNTQKDVGTNGHWFYKIYYKLDCEIPGYPSGDEHTLMIRFNDNTNIFEDIAVFNNNAYSANIQITQIEAGYSYDDGNIEQDGNHSDISKPYMSQLLPSDIILEVVIETERYYDLVNNPIAIDPATAGRFLLPGSVPPLDENKGMLCWQYIDGAEEYDVEWVFIDKQDGNTTYSTTPGNVNYVFDLKEPVRITTSLQSYYLDMVYPEGYLFFRFRPVGRYFQNAPDYNYAGEWVHIESTEGNKGFSVSEDEVDENIIDDIDPTVNYPYKANWQYTVTFAEDAKSKNVINYLDGTYRSMQSITNLSSDNASLVAETKYDSEGRKAVSILPTPLNSNSLAYHSIFTKNLDSEVFSALSLEAGTLISDKIKLGTGAGSFYSTSNGMLPTDPNDIRNNIKYLNYIPIANGFPYIATRYTLDNTNKICESSGPGIVHALDGGHTKKYFYGNTNFQELAMHFRKNAEPMIADFYKKNLEVDENNQVTINYLDQNNKVIVSSLSSNSPNNLLSAAADVVVKADLSTTNCGASYSYTSSSNQILNTKILLLETDHSEYHFLYEVGAQSPIFTYGPIIFSYNIPGVSTLSQCTIPQISITDNKEYDLEITITDPDGELLLCDENVELTGTNYVTKPVGSIAEYETEAGYLKKIKVTDVLSINIDQLKFTVDMRKIGNYKITKKLIIKTLTPAQLLEQCFLPGSGNITFPDGISCDGESTTMAGLQTFLVSQFTTTQSFLDECAVEVNSGYANGPMQQGAAANCSHQLLLLKNQVSPQDPYCTDGSGELMEGRYYNINSSIWAPAAAACTSATTIPGYSEYLTENSYTHDETNFITFLHQTTPNPWVNNDYSNYLVQFHPEYKIYQYYCETPIGTTLTPNPILLSLQYDLAQIATLGNTLFTATPLPYLANDPITIDAIGTPQAHILDVYNLLLNNLTAFSINPYNQQQESLTNFVIRIINTGTTEDNLKRWQLYASLYKTLKEDAIRSVLVSEGLYVTSGTPCNEQSVYTPVDALVIPLVGAQVPTNPVTEEEYAVLQDAGPSSGLPEFTSSEADIYQTVLNWFRLMDTPCDGMFIDVETPYTNYTVKPPFIRSYPDDIGDINYSANINKLQQAWSSLYTYAYSTMYNEPATPVNECINPSGYLMLGPVPINADIAAAEASLQTIVSPTTIPTDCDALTTISLNSIICQQNLPLYVDTWMNNLLSGTNLGTSQCSDFIIDLVPTTFEQVKEKFNDLFYDYAYARCREATTLFDGTLPAFTAADCATPGTANIFLCEISNIIAELTSYNHNCIGISQYSNFTTNTTVTYYSPNQPITNPSIYQNEVGEGAVDLITVLNQIWFFKNKEAIQAIPIQSPLHGTDCEVAISPFSNNYFLMAEDGKTISFEQCTTPEFCKSATLIFKTRNSSGDFDAINPSLICRVFDLRYEPSNYGNVFLKISAKVEYYDILLQEFKVVDAYLFGSLCNALILIQPITPNPDIDPIIPTAEEDCYATQVQVATYNANQVINNLLNTIASVYQNTDYSNNMPVETYTCEYYLGEGLTTLYYYDNAGNLIKTLPGFEVATLAATYLWKKDNLATVYLFNSENQLIEKGLPEDTVWYHYSLNGLLRFTEGKEQKSHNKFSYLKYDQQGRINESGESNFNYTANPYLSLGNMTKFWDMPSSNILGSTKTYFDKQLYNLGVTVTLDNTRSRIVHSVYKNNENNFGAGMHYSYDEHGNVKDLYQDYYGIGLKHINYKYDLISNKVTEVNYQDGDQDAFYHKYEYDADNRLTNVYTSKNKIIWERDAKYFYYMNGPLARMELGDNKVQGVDYAYTIQGWIKGVNSEQLLPESDIGNDARHDASYLNSWTGADAAGYSLTYFSNLHVTSLLDNGQHPDYNSISNNANPFCFKSEANMLHDDILTDLKFQLFNGNILKSVTSIRNISATGSSFGAPMPLAAAYEYDQANRFRKASYQLQSDLSINAIWQNIHSGIFDNTAEYDGIGNIKHLVRYSNQSNQIDDLNYTYVNENSTTGNATSKLEQITDSYGPLLNSVGPQEYDYDLSGNLIGIHETNPTIKNWEISWTSSGKINDISIFDDVNNSNRIGYLQYFYDALGNRIKMVDSKPGTPDQITQYIKDVQGNTMVEYEYDSNPSTIDALHYPIYGSSRLGMFNTNSDEDLRPKAYNRPVGVINFNEVISQFPGTFKISMETSDDGINYINFPNTASTVYNIGSMSVLESNINNSTVFDYSALCFSNTIDKILYIYNNDLSEYGKYMKIICKDNSGVGTETLGEVILSDFFGLSSLEASNSHMSNKKTYELTNHLGNVISTVSDIKHGVAEQETNTVFDENFEQDMTRSNFDLDINYCYANIQSLQHHSGINSLYLYENTGMPFGINAHGNNGAYVSFWVFAYGSGTLTNTKMQIIVNKAATPNADPPILSYDVFLFQTNEWKKLEQTFTLPNYSEQYIIKVIPVSLSTSIATWFDDLHVEITGHDMATYYTPHILSAQDYYPGGSIMPGRSYNSTEYPFSYQGSMKDDEITGVTGAHITTFFRENDTRIMRWWSVDPEGYKTPWESPYMSMSGNPILLNDPLGNTTNMDEWEMKNMKNGDVSYNKIGNKGGNETQYINYTIEGDGKSSIKDPRRDTKIWNTSSKKAENWLKSTVASTNNRRADDRYKAHFSKTMGDFATGFSAAIYGTFAGGASLIAGGGFALSFKSLGAAVADASVQTFDNGIDEVNWMSTASQLFIPNPLLSSTIANTTKLTINEGFNLKTPTTASDIGKIALGAATNYLGGQSSNALVGTGSMPAFNFGSGFFGNLYPNTISNGVSKQIGDGK